MQSSLVFKFDKQKIYMKKFVQVELNLDNYLEHLSMKYAYKQYKEFVSERNTAFLSIK